MATQDLEKLIVKLDADLRSYERALAKAQGVTTSQMRKIEREVQRSATRVESSFARMSTVFKDFGKGFVAGVGITGIAALGRAIQDTISQAAKIGDLADKLGLGTDALQALEHGAVQADMSFQDMDKTLLRFSKTLGEAANGQGEYLKTLRANGQEIQGSFLGNLRQLADLVANAKNEQEALLIITQAMGKGSDGWLEVLKNGSKGLTDLGTAAKAAGAQIEEELIRKAQVLDDKWAALMQSLSAQTRTAVLTIIGELQKLESAIPSPNELGQMAGGWIERNVFGVTGPRQMPQGALPRTSAGSGILSPTKPTTKVSNPEEEAEKRRILAERLREEKRARDELVRSIEREFEAFTRNLTQIDEQIAAMQLEQQTLGMSTAEIERHRVAQELLNEANRAGVPVTAEMNQVIQAKAKAYGEAAQALEDTREKQELVRESVSGFLQDIRSGTDPVDALTAALDRLSQKLLDMALDDFFTQKGGGGGGLKGFVSAIASMFHGGGVVGQGGGRSKAVHPGVFRNAHYMHGGGLASDEVPAILQKGEIVLPKGFRPSGRGGYGNVTIHNYGGQIEQKQVDRGGMRDLEIWFDTRLDKKMADPYSGASGALASRGARAPVKRR